VWPLIDGHHIEFISEIDEQQKSTFLGNALALLFPISWPEPFGLVMVEAMACATPVIAFPCGSVPEVVDDGITGFVVDAEHALSGIDEISKLERRQIRARFEQRFTARRMARDYIRIYEMLLQSSAMQQQTRADESAAFGARRV